MCNIIVIVIGQANQSDKPILSISLSHPSCTCTCTDFVDVNSVPQYMWMSL